MAGMVYEDVLAHYGVLGMKWGVRKRDDDGMNRVQRRQAKRDEKSNGLKSRAAAEQKTLDSLNRQGTKSQYMLKKYGPAMGVDTQAAQMRIQLLNFGRTKEQLLAAEKKNVEHSRQHFLDDAKLAAAGKWTSKSKMLLGAGIALAVIGSAVGAIVLKQKFDAKQLAQMAARAKDESRAFADYDAMMAKAKATDERLAAIKPGDKVSKGDWWEKLLDTEMDRLSGTSKDAFEGMDDTPVSVPPGRVFHRITTDKEETLRKRLYASVTEDDNERYKATMPMFWEKRNDGLRAMGFDPDDDQGIPDVSGRKPPKGGAFQVAIKAVNEIRSPGEKTRIQEYINLLDKPVKVDEEMSKYITSINNQRVFAGSRPINAATAKIRDLLDDGNNTDLTNEEFGLQYYRNFAMGLAQDSPVNSMYFDAMKAKGFNAIIDDNDAGKLSDQPWLIFDSVKDLQRIGATALTSEDIQKAQDNIKELLNRR